MSEGSSDGFDLSGRVAILTGGAGLLGRQFTQTLLRAGARVAVADLRPDAAQQVANEAVALCGSEAFGMGVDIRQIADVEKMVDDVCRRWKSIDILINNAAIDPKFDAELAEQQADTFENYPLELWQQSLDTNLTGTFLCCQAVGRMMVRQKRGVIVNISSTYGVVAPDQRLYARDDEENQTRFKPAAYAVTKAAVAHLTRYLAAYWGACHIRVNTLTPHGIYTSQDAQFLKRFTHRSPLGRMAQEDEMNGALLFLVSDASSYMTGANLVVDGGWTTW